MADLADEIELFLAPYIAAQEAGTLSGDGTLLDQMKGLADQLEAGSIDQATFTAAFNGLLSAAYLRSYSSGIEASGTGADFTVSDLEVVRRLADEQVPFVDGMATAIVTAAVVMPIATRLAQYANSTYNVYVAGKTEKLLEPIEDGPEPEVHWNTQGDGDVCDPCREAGEGSPYTAATLPGLPADVCEGGSSCRCDIDAQPADTAKAAPRAVATEAGLALGIAAAQADLSRWRRKTLAAVKAGKSASSVRFESQAIPPEVMAFVKDAAARSGTGEEVSAVFERCRVALVSALDTRASSTD